MVVHVCWFKLCVSVLNLTLQEFSYAHEFYNQEGVTQLLDIIKRTPIFESMNCSILALSLQALCLVMEYMGTELWTKILDNNAIKKVYLYICIFVYLYICDLPYTLHS